MRENRYALAGWLAIAHAAILPLAFGVGLFEELIGYSRRRLHTPQLGLSDLLSVVGVVFIVYALYTFRKLLNERYNYRGADLLIMLSIWWVVGFTALLIVVQGGMVLFSPVSEATMLLIYAPFFALSMITIGVIDIILAVKLLRVKDKLNDLIVAFAYISLVAGLMEVTVLLSFVSLVLVPVSSVVLGMILLREKEEVEFV